jgi:hypothetical protein
MAAAVPQRRKAVAAAASHLDATDRVVQVLQSIQERSHGR